MNLEKLFNMEMAKKFKNEEPADDDVEAIFLKYFDGIWGLGGFPMDRKWL